MSDFTIIQPHEIPALHQSTETMMACPTFYVEAAIKKNRKPVSMESARGNQVHDVHSKYSDHCAANRVSMDLDAFDKLAKGAGPLAAKILSGIRDSYEVDWEHLLATEISFALDEDFNPTHVPDKARSEVNDSGEYAAYEGTLDVLLSFRDALAMQIDDAKTHPRPFDPDDTLQGRLYALFVFLHFPWVQEVKFRLVFVRYHKLTREVVYTRAEIPKLMETARAARHRQFLIHEMVASGEKLDAIPGPHCVYCPLLANATCPVAKYNEHMQLTPEQRLKFNLWYSAFSAVNNKTLKEYVQETGREVVLKDFNGKAYKYGPVESESTIYPLFLKTAEGIAFQCSGCGYVIDHAIENGRCPRCERLMKPVMPIVDLIVDYANTTPDDIKWMGKLVLSSTTLNQPLSTKKRAMLDQAVTDTAEHVTKVRMQASKPLDRIENEEPEEGEFDDEF